MADSNFTVQYPLPVAFLNGKIKSSTTILTFYFGIEESFKTVNKNFNLAFGNIKEKESSAKDLRKLLSIFAAVNQDLASGEGKQTTVADKHRNFYMNPDDLSDPKMLILAEALRGDEGSCRYMRLWFVTCDRSFTKRSIGKAFYNRLLNNSQNKEDGQTNNKEKYKKSESASGADMFLPSSQKIDKDTWIYDVCKKFGNSSSLSGLSKENITEKTYTQEDSPLNPCNYFSPENMLSYVSEIVCKDQRTLQNYFDLSLGEAKPESFKGFPFPELVYIIRPQYFIPSSIREVPILLFNKDTGNQIRIIENGINRLKTKQLELENHYKLLKAEKNDDAALKVLEDLQNIRNKIKAFDEKKTSVYKADIEKKISIDWKGSDFRTTMESIQEMNWTVKMREKIEEEKKRNKDLLPSKRGTKEYAEATERMTDIYLREFKNKAEIGEKMVNPFKSVVHHLHENKGEMPCMPKVCMNLGTYDSIIASLAYFAERFLNVYGPVNLFFVNLIAGLSSFEWTFGPRPNTFITGCPGIGKSATTNAVASLFSPGLTKLVSHQTGKSLTINGDESDTFTIYQEAPNSLFGTTEKYSNPNAEDAILKTALSEGVVFTKSIKIVDGARMIDESMNRVFRTHVVNSNDPLLSKNSAIMSRFLQVSVEQVKNAALSIPKALLSVKYGVNDLAMKQDFIHGMQLAISHLYIYEKLMEAAIVPPIDTGVFDVTVERLFESLEKRGYVINDVHRKISMEREAARALHMFISILIECSELGDRYRKDKKRFDEEEEEEEIELSWFNEDFYKSLRKYGVITEEIVVFVLTLYAGNIIPINETDVAHALADIILGVTVNDNQRDKICLPKSAGGIFERIEEISFRKYYDNNRINPTTGKPHLVSDFNYITIRTKDLERLNLNISQHMKKPISHQDVGAAINKLSRTYIKTPSKFVDPSTGALVDIGEPISREVVFIEQTKGGDFFVHILVDYVKRSKPLETFLECLKESLSFSDLPERDLLIAMNYVHSRDIGEGQTEDVEYTSIYKTLHIPKSTKKEVLFNNFSRNKGDYAFQYSVPYAFRNITVEESDENKLTLNNTPILIPNGSFQDIKYISYWINNGLLIADDWNEKHPLNILLNINTIVEYIRKNHPEFSKLDRIKNYPEDLVSYLEIDFKTKNDLKCKAHESEVSKTYDASSLLNTVKEKTCYPYKFSIEDIDEDGGMNPDNIDFASMAIAYNERKQNQRPVLSTKRKMDALKYLVDYCRKGTQKKKRLDSDKYNTRDSSTINSATSFSLRDSRNLENEDESDGQEEELRLIKGNKQKADFTGILKQNPQDVYEESDSDDPDDPTEGWF